MQRRRLVAALGLTVMAGPAGCRARRAERSVGPPAAPVGTAPPAPAPEALWMVDATGSLRAVDARTNQVAAARVDLGGAAPTGWRVTGSDTVIWAYSHDGRVVRVDPVAATVTARARVAATDVPAEIRLGITQEALWVLQRTGVTRVDNTGRVTTMALPAGFAPTAATRAGRWIWVGASDGRLLRIDPAGGSATEPRIEPLPAGVIDLATGPDGLVVSTNNRPDIAVLDPDTGAARASVRIGEPPASAELYGSADAVWAVGTNGVAVKVTRGPSPTRVLLSRVSQGFPAAMALGSLWIGDEVESTLLRIPLDQGLITAKMAVPSTDDQDPLFSVLAGRHTVWLVDSSGPRAPVLRVDPAANRVAPPSAAVDAVGQPVMVARPPRP